MSRVLSLIKILVVWGIIVAVLILSNPSELPSVALIVPFILFFIAIYITVKETIWLLSGEEKNDPAHLRATRPKLIAGLVASFPVILLVLQSIGQLTAWDVLTAIALFIVAYFYVMRASMVSPKR